MIEEAVGERSETVILRFNPWLFSGTEQLVVRFLQEVSVQLGEKADKSCSPQERLTDEFVPCYAGRNREDRAAGVDDVLVETVVL